MKTLFRTFALLLAVQSISQTCFADALVRIVTSHQLQDEKTALKSTYEDGKYVFERCKMKKTHTTSEGSTTRSHSTLVDCKIIGDSKGYTEVQILKRINELKSQRRTERFYDAGKIVAGVMAGGMAGGVALSTQTDDVFNIFYAFPIGFVFGGATGGGIVSYLVWGTEANAQIEFLKQASIDKGAPVLLIEIDDMDLNQAIRDLNINLAGIFE